MEFQLQIPTKIIVGEGCVRKNAAVFSALGSHAAIVKSGSADKNGALADVLYVLEKAGISAQICDNVPPNPSPDDVGALLGYAPNIDFVVAIGGGSAMDAAKGVAILAVNDIEPMGMYKKPYVHCPLPVIAIPTTCGTGSEVTAVSVLEVENTKKSVSSPELFPVCALLDAVYLKTLPPQVAVDTALDALSHCVEGYLILDSPATQMFAENAFEYFARIKCALKKREFSQQDAERMLYMSTIGGIVISMAGTSAVHTIGYPLTVKRNIPHGRACALTLGEYVSFSYDVCTEKIDKMCAILQVDGVRGFCAMLDELLGEKPTFTNEELELYTDIATEDACKKKNTKPLTKMDVLHLYLASLLG
ncbi:MAG: iron-containing alcohol dehydrogenase [Christensenella sp.]